MTAPRAALPFDAADRVQRLAGVEAAGTYSELDLGDDAVTGVQLVDPTATKAREIPVIAASAGLLDTELGELATGRFFDAGHDDRADRVVVLGSRAAATLAINRVDARPTIFIGRSGVHRDRHHRSGAAPLLTCWTR